MQGCSPLQEECQKPENQQTEVCKAINGYPTARCRPSRPAAARRSACPAITAPDPAAAGDRLGLDRLRSAGPDDGRADGRLRPRPGQPAGPGDGDPMITRRTKIQLLVFVLITLRRRELRRRPLRPARPALRRRHLHGGRALPGLRRHLRRRRGDLPRRAGRPGRRAGAHRGGRRRLPRHRERLRRHPGRHHGAGRQPLRGRRAVRRAPAAGRRRALPAATTPRSRWTDTRDPDRDHDAADQPVQHRRVGRQGRPAHVGHRARARRSPAPARTSAGSSTPATPSSRPPTRTSTSPPP